MAVVYTQYLVRPPREKLLDNIEEKTLLNFNHTMDSHERLAVQLRNTSSMAKEAIMKEIRNNSKTVLLHQGRLVSLEGSLKANALKTGKEIELKFHRLEESIQV